MTCLNISDDDLLERADFHAIVGINHFPSKWE